MISKLRPAHIVMVDRDIKLLCCSPYTNHKNGCPNYCKKKGCPPQPEIQDILKFDGPMCIIWTEFNIGEHANRMKIKHPKWTWRQCVCCLYWQPKARKKHREEISRVLNTETSDLKILNCPEAHSVNVFETMRNIGTELERVPKNIVRLVSIVGYSK